MIFSIEKINKMSSSSSPETSSPATIRVERNINQVIQDSSALQTLEATAKEYMNGRSSGRNNKAPGDIVDNNKIFKFYDIICL